nr:hypothetical protein [Tanacetum cinerariifolium]
SPPKKDLSWTGLPEFADDTVTDYSRPSPAVESPTDDLQNRNPFVTETGASPSIIIPKPFIKKFPTGSTKFSISDMGKKGNAVKASGSSQNNIDDKGYWDSGCSRHMTGNISYLSDYEPFDGRYVSFGQGGCKITGKGTIKTDKLEFENVYFMKDLKHMTGNISYLSDYEPFDGGYVSFGQEGCKITDKRTIKTGKLEFENVYFVKDLKYN